MQQTIVLDLPQKTKQKKNIAPLTPSVMAKLNERRV